VPIMVGMPLSEKEFIKPAQAGKALELADDRFYSMEDYEVAPLDAPKPVEYEVERGGMKYTIRRKA
jgi:hypothetical protein